jgi:hypothetical protein
MPQPLYVCHRVVVYYERFLTTLTLVGHSHLPMA